MTKNAARKRLIIRAKQKKKEKEKFLNGFWGSDKLFFLLFNVVSHGYEGTLIDVGNVFVIRETVICFPQTVLEYDIILCKISV